MRRFFFIAILFLTVLTVLLLLLKPGMIQGWMLKNNRDLEAILKRGELRLITSYNSTGYFVYKDVQMGFEYEMAAQMAKDLGVKLKVVVVKDPGELLSYLNAGKGDLVAYHLPVVNLPDNNLKFSSPYVQTEQVLVQLKRPIKDTLYVAAKDALMGKTVVVPENSPYLQSLQDISFELRNRFNVSTVSEGITTEDLIRNVAEGKLLYTVSNKEVAYVNKGYYPQIDIETSLTAPQDIAFGLHRRSPELLKKVNEWIEKQQQNGKMYALYSKYFRSSRYIAANDDDSTVVEEGDGTFISAYDPLIRQYAKDIRWDWRLLAALIWQESRFKPSARSWAGASGLMQLMPATARRFGLYSMQEIYTPELNIKTGTKYIDFLNGFWKEISDPNERLKFIIASYNAGEGHVKDATRLAKKYGYNPHKWDGNVEIFILNKSKPQYYRDPVCKYGYCRGSEPFHYVKKIVQRYGHYKSTIKAEENMPVFDLYIETQISEDDLEAPFYSSKPVNTIFREKPLFQEKPLFKEKTLSGESAGNPKYHNTLNIQPGKEKADTLVPKKGAIQQKKEIFQPKSPFSKPGTDEKYFNNLKPKQP